MGGAPVNGGLGTEAGEQGVNHARREGVSAADTIEDLEVRKVAGGVAGVAVAEDAAPTVS